MMVSIRGDKTLFMITLLLVCLGLVMIYSASAILAARRYDDSLYFFKKQFIWVGLGLTLLWITSRIPYDFWRAWAIPLVFASIGLLALVLFPGAGVEINGSRRWLRFGDLTFQPSEAARLFVVVYLARYLAKNPERMADFWKGMVPPLVLCGTVIALILAESDLGSAVLIATVGGLLLFAGEARWRHLGFLGLLSLPVLYSMIMRFDYRRERLMTFMDPWKDPTDSGFQMVQSFMAFGSGGTFGAGLGEGHQKLFFLPYPHTDFIFAVIGEELGLIGAVAVVALFGIFLWRGLTVSLKAPDLFGRYLAFGLTMMILVQAMINLGVTTGLLPTKGMTLPFVSYGGSSL
ncbi:MAG TPA: putative lipid II flippase FtsW, partial [Nitrospiria bacterium]